MWILIVRTVVYLSEMWTNQKMVFVGGSKSKTNSRHFVEVFASTETHGVKHFKWNKNSIIEANFEYMWINQTDNSILFDFGRSERIQRVRDVGKKREIFCTHFHIWKINRKQIYSSMCLLCVCVCPFKHSFDFVLKIDSIERECTCVYPTCTMYTSHVYHIDRLLCALHMLSFSHFVCDAMGHAKINKSMNNSQGCIRYKI